MCVCHAHTIDISVQDCLDAQQLPSASTTPSKSVSSSRSSSTSLSSSPSPTVFPSYVPVPDPSTWPASKRMGAYYWNANYDRFCATESCQPNPLMYVASLISKLGSRTIRTEFAGSGIGMSFTGKYSPFAVASTAWPQGYKDLFDSPDFDNYLLTLKPSLGNRAQFADVTEYLLRQYAAQSKTFIFLQWELDNAMCSDGTPASEWCSGLPPTSTEKMDNLIYAINERVLGIADGIRRVASANITSNSKVYSGLEYNLVRWRANCNKAIPGDCDCNTSNRLCVISYVAPRVNVDYYSYSSWQSISPDKTTPTLAASLQADMTSALNLVKTGRPEVEARNFILGEYGYNSEIKKYTQDDQIERVGVTNRAFASWGGSYTVFWQVIDSSSDLQPSCANCVARGYDYALVLPTNTIPNDPTLKNCALGTTLDSLASVTCLGRGFVDTIQNF